MPNHEVRCSFCRHRLNSRDAELNPVHVQRQPPNRGGTPRRDNLIPACALCAQAKGPLTEGEYRQVMGFPERLKNWVRLIHGASLAEDRANVS